MTGVTRQGRAAKQVAARPKLFAIVIPAKFRSLAANFDHSHTRAYVHTGTESTPGNRESAVQVVRHCSRVPVAN